MKNLVYKSGTPYSQKFGDFYFNTDSFSGESEYVFISAVDEIFNQKESFIVAEAGFGVGRNFLNLAKKFKKSDKNLHYISIEAFPLDKESLAEIYKNLGIRGRNLLKKFPPLINGLHRIEYAKNITLDLYFGDIDQALDELDFKADVWFMDGFSPAKNPDMWSKNVFKKIARLTKIGGILATYTSAKSVNEAMSEAGFCVKKIAGFGRKREMIRAKLENLDDKIKEFYLKRGISKSSGKSVLIIGAGIAGLVSAFKLSRLGFSVVVAEKNESVGLNGSGNFTGVAEPLITKKGVKLGDMHIHAFLLAKNFYKKELPKSLIKFTNAKEFAYDDELFRRYESIEESEIYEFLREDKPYPSVLIKDAALAKPHKICKFLAKNLDVKCGFEFVNFSKNGEKFLSEFKNGEILESDILIFTMGSHSEELFGKGQNPKICLDESMQISSVRGQTTTIKKSVKTSLPLSAKGYICPAIGGLQLIGSTYDRGDYNENISDMDNAKNLANISEFIDKKTKILGSKVGFRSYSGDRFPIVGAFVSDDFSEVFKDLPWSKKKELDRFPSYKPNLYINAGHGSRGLCTAILGAEIVCDLILNRPLCLPKSLFNEISPNRFLIRKLKKGLK